MIGNMIAKKYQKYYEKLFDRNDGLGKYVFDLAIERYIVERSLKKENNNKKLVIIWLF